jgi:glutamate N-acetyltransferase/amino-acid N-acetyltransferase
VKLAKMVAADGEGATKLLECVVSGAENEDQAEALAKSVISSSLVKAAFFGEDANWGRVLCAMGYAGVPFDPAKVNLAFASKGGRVELCAKGAVLPFDEALASKVLAEKEIRIEAELGMGSAEAVAWGCDLTYDYVKINGDYRT